MRRSLVPTLLAVGSLALATPASAAVTAVAVPDHPLAGCTAGADGSGVSYPGAEVEPSLAGSGSLLVGAVQQDRWSDGGSHAQTTVRSTDGGATWQLAGQPAFGACSGGTLFDRVSDAWVSVGPDGTVYQAALGFDGNDAATGILASVSHDAGSTWSAPVPVEYDTSANASNDKEAVTADPTRPGTAYVVWDQIAKPGTLGGNDTSLAARGIPLFSRTTDFGATWSTPRSIYQRNGNPNTFTIGNQVVVQPDGTLVDVTALDRGSGVQPSRAARYVQATFRSTDGGDTWTGPYVIAPILLNGLTDPDNGTPIRAGDDLPSVAQNPADGTLYVAWADTHPGGGTERPVISRSTDGGRTWTAPVLAGDTPAGVEGFTPAIAVGSDGTVGLTWDDLRGNTPAPGLPTDQWFTRYTADLSGHDAVQHVAGPFDLERAPVAEGYFLGDYQGMVARGTGFGILGVVTTADPANPTDLFYAAVS